MKHMTALGGALAAFACVAVGLGLALALNAYSQPAAELARPDDVERWVTIGVTVRLDGQDNTTPWQMRQVLMAPADYERFVETGAFQDGTRFAVSFYPVARDASHQPPLYHPLAEEALAIEVIDRSHPDGRRFYVFPAGVARASPMSPGNECAACHNARGGFDGTFAQMYPLLARRLGEAEPR